MTDAADLLETRAWKTSDGDPSAPRRVLGRQVTTVLLVSDEPASAVVLLADGRCALTGHRLVVGGDRLTALAAERERNTASL